MGDAKIEYTAQELLVALRATIDVIKPLAKAQSSTSRGHQLNSTATKLLSHFIKNVSYEVWDADLHRAKSNPANTISTKTLLDALVERYTDSTNDRKYSKLV